MISESIYEVSRNEYKSFIETIKPECRRVENIEMDRWHKATKVYSLKTNKCLASRITYIKLYPEEEGEPERYYIFELPDAEETIPPIPKIKILLETKEEVQQFIDGIKTLREKEQNNG